MDSPNFLQSSSVRCSLCFLGSPVILCCMTVHACCMSLSPWKTPYRIAQPLCSVHLGKLWRFACLSMPDFIDKVAGKHQDTIAYRVLFQMLSFLWSLSRALYTARLALICHFWLTAPFTNQSAFSVVNSTSVRYWWSNFLFVNIWWSTVLSISIWWNYIPLMLSSWSRAEPGMNFAVDSYPARSSPWRQFKAACNGSGPSDDLARKQSVAVELDRQMLTICCNWRRQKALEGVAVWCGDCQTKLSPACASTYSYESVNAPGWRLLLSQAGRRPRSINAVRALWLLNREDAYAIAAFKFSCQSCWNVR